MAAASSSHSSSSRHASLQQLQELVRAWAGQQVAQTSTTCSMLSGRAAAVMQQLLRWLEAMAMRLLLALTPGLVLLTSSSRWMAKLGSYASSCLAVAMTAG
jgi:hypothetical protein